MIMLKLWTLLFANALILCQMYISEAAPSRTSKEFITDGVPLLNNEAETLLRVIKDYIEMTPDEAAEEEVEEERPVSKRCTGLSTCVLGRLSQDIHKLQTYPRTDVGAGTPGKKRRSPFERFENYSKSNTGNDHF
ncbi:calcitonin/calcitonin-related polypeptide, alpha isoform X1 [Oryzias melastigma]|uniref:Calcitonin related polypeptide beta n=1 Tax=Oryzias melastigma TaxID=30732 RepID=A0A3B3DZE2_ORYME|nr:calcitonin/calcitonin-related polypeptide, alpha isoform X1 [Oryzias melastigma]XP_036066034.1 calcitonin/calcitonin-related polypeptide, alpha isoform X1 [Oryzias melastigma]